jgi:molybdopterin/thiamine biosynthesis adenylyltransferase
MAMTAEQIERHKRHILLKDIGGPGVQRLINGSVSIIGAGALGGPCALYLAAAGVGHIEIWDDDTVDRSNLQRQVQFGEADIGRAKAVCLAERLTAINPDVNVTVHQRRFGAGETF